MSDISVSVIVVSRGRPAGLSLTLTGISQQQYRQFEVIVVADPDGVKAAKALNFADALKIVAFDEPNISMARNLGLAQAAAEVVAFIDDDAVPEPRWLYHLCAPARRADVAAMGGYVRGRNGISYQWKAQSLDALGEAHPLDIDAVLPTVLKPANGTAIKTEGTNMAFRRDVLIEMGGFDSAFAYFLDETDVNMRIARAGHATALVPLAEVHHGYGANAMRTAGRVPRDLFDLGASLAVFQRKHVHKSEHGSQWQRMCREQRARLLQHMIAGTLEPRELRRLQKRLVAGYAEGQTRQSQTVNLPRHAAEPFRGFPAKKRQVVQIATSPLLSRRAKAKAVQAVANGQIVTLLNLSPTALFHQLRFDPDGYWVQKGGLFGRSDRGQPLIRIATRKRRAAAEAKRVAAQRGLCR